MQVRIHLVSFDTFCAVHTADGAGPQGVVFALLMNAFRLSFHTTLGRPDDAPEIVLESCHAVADLNFSLADIQRTDQWRYDYISLASNPVCPYVPIATVH